MERKRETIIQRKRVKGKGKSGRKIYKGRESVKEREKGERHTKEEKERDREGRERLRDIQKRKI